MVKRSITITNGKFTCPNCKKRIPRSVHCPTCGLEFPSFMHPR